MSDLRQRPRPRLRLRLNPDRCLLRVEPETMLDERKEKIKERRIKGQIEGVTPMPQETGHRVKL